MIIFNFIISNTSDIRYLVKVVLYVSISIFILYIIFKCLLYYCYYPVILLYLFYLSNSN